MGGGADDEPPATPRSCDYHLRGFRSHDIVPRFVDLRSAGPARLSGMDVVEAVAAALEDAHPDWGSVAVTGGEEIARGWESIVSGFVARTPSGALPIVLRCYSGGGGADTAKREFDGMTRLHAAGFPVPRVLACEPDPARAGLPFILMERIDGVTMWPLIFGEDGVDREAFHRFVDLLARLHRLDAQAFTDSPVSVGDQLDAWRAVISRYPLPGFDSAVAWLEARSATVPPVAPAVVHWDYHPDNVLAWADGRIAAVVDWTQITVTDPRFDLAWTVVLVGTHQGSEIAYAIRGRYESTAGTRFEAMDFFEVAACVKRLYSVAVSLIAGPELLGMHPDTAESMRRQLEPLGWVYRRFTEHTGLRIAAVEELLS